VATEYCPQCATARVGALRFCRSCAFDYDTLPQAEVRAPVSAEPRPAPADALVAPEPPVAISAAAGPSSSRRGWILLGGVIFIAVVAAAAFIALGNSGVLAPHHDVTGSFDLIDTSTDFPSISKTGSGCKGTSGYSDIGPGTNVTIKNGEGKILATGSLGDGTGTLTRCTFSFTLCGVLGESRPYSDVYQSGARLRSSARSIETKPGRVRW
jgi:hypothetical protein